ncbi:hypothetical protein [Anaerotignum sp.]
MMFQKWIPTNNLGNAYDMESITWGNTISFTLVADKKRVAQDNIQRFQLEWNSSHIISYHVTDETYRADCWGLDFENNGRFYTSNNSDYIETFQNKSPLFPDNAIHFLIVGTNTIVDVLAKEYPTVRIID